MVIVIMKWLKILTGIVFFLLLLQGFALVNLMVSDKQEISLMESHIRTNSELSQSEKNTRLEKLKERSEEIQKQKRNTKITALVLLIIFIVLCVVLVKKSNTK